MYRTPAYNLFHHLGILILALAGAILPVLLAGQDIKLGLFTQARPAHVLISTANGAFSVIANDVEVVMLQQGQSVYMLHTSGGITLKTGDKEHGPFQKIEVRSLLPSSFFKLLCLQPASKEQWYEGSLEVSNTGESIRLINNIGLESYLGGVVEAETGAEQTIEFYKLQASICRTFALANFQKHMAEGFNLCDRVHCQVYKGRPHSNPDILKGVAETAGNIIVDYNLQLIDAVFHSNCGGQTHNSEEYWKDRVSYLRSVKDTFCADGQQNQWRLSIPRDKWLAYLAGNFNFPVNDSLLCYQACHHVPEGRKEFMLDPVYKVGLRKIRSDWNLRSTYFATTEEGENVILLGRGYGHGVGMCQEGAMKMAKLGHSYTDILHFYFKDVFLVPKDMLGYLKGF